MSDFNNNLNNQPPYSYNWNGGDNNGGKKSGGKVFVIIAIVVALLATIVVTAFLASKYPLSSPYGLDESNGSDGSVDISAEISGDSGKDNTSYPVPDFTPSGDADTDLSNVLTQIYENCSPACCTVSVSYRGQPYSIGSGFVIDSEHGYIATNHHVIESGTEISVVFYDGKEYEAVVINSDPVTDLAVLKVEAKGLAQVEFGNSNNIKVGENVVAIGTPYDEGLAGTMTCGIISGIARDIEISNDSGKVVKTMTLIQTDCSINPGNSGGPLIDMAGNVVGITSLKLVDEQYEGIGFAIPISSAIDIFKKLIAGEDIGDTDIATATAKIGITAYALDAGLERFRMYPRCEYPEGVLVGEIEYDSAAYIAGLSVCDIITDFNGDAVKSLDDLSAALEKYKAGQEVTVTVFRFTDRTLSKGESVTVTFKLDAAE